MLLYSPTQETSANWREPSTAQGRCVRVKARITKLKIFVDIFVSTTRNLCWHVKQHYKNRDRLSRLSKHYLKLNNVGFDRYLVQVAWPPIVSVSPHPLDPMCLVTIGGRELWGTGLQIYLTNFTSRTETEATLLLTSFGIISKQKN